MAKPIYQQIFSYQPEAALPEKMSISYITLHRSGVILAIRLIVLEFIFFGIFLLLRFPLSFFVNSVENAATLYTVNTILYIVLILFHIILILLITFQWLKSYYEVRPGRILYISGLLSRHEKEFTYVNISKVNFSQSFLGRVFNYGTVNLYTPISHEWFSLYDIPEPRRNLQLIRKILTSKRLEIHMSDDANEK